MSALTPSSDAEAAYRRQLAFASELEKARIGMNFARILGEQSRWYEALILLEPWETSGGPPGASLVARIIGAGNASEMRLALGQVELATRDIELIEQLVRDNDVPDFWSTSPEARHAHASACTQLTPVCVTGCELAEVAEVAEAGAGRG